MMDYYTAGQKRKRRNYYRHSKKDSFACGLELHPEKTKIVYCKDEIRKGEYDNTSFDFLGYAFRRRIAKNRRGKLFLNFTPGVSKASLKAMSRTIRKRRVRSRTDLSLSEIARWINPIIQGWLNYYGKFYRSLLYQMCRQVNKALVNWARRKYKKLKHHKNRACLFLEKIANSSKQLFAHWKQGMVGAFA